MGRGRDGRGARSGGCTHNGSERNFGASVGVRGAAAADELRAKGRGASGKRRVANGEWRVLSGERRVVAPSGESGESGVRSWAPGCHPGWAVAAVVFESGDAPDEHRHVCMYVLRACAPRRELRRQRVCVRCGRLAMREGEWLVDASRVECERADARQLLFSALRDFVAVTLRWDYRNVSIKPHDLPNTQIIK